MNFVLFLHCNEIFCNNQQKKKKKKICKIVDFAVPADHRIKLKECEKRDKYLDLARELKKLWNMKVTIIIFTNQDMTQGQFLKRSLAGMNSQFSFS